MKKHFKITNDLSWNQIIWRANKRAGKKIWLFENNKILHRNHSGESWIEIKGYEDKKMFISHCLHIDPETGIMDDMDYMDQDE